jgi:hypothetical protein
LPVLISLLHKNEPDHPSISSCREEREVRLLNSSPKGADDKNPGKKNLYREKPPKNLFSG